ncbi:DUF6123 family protein, partial [Bacillus sp. D-CC]
LLLLRLQCHQMHPIIAEIEATIKHQLQFDGSYFVALLERLKEEEITDKKSAKAFMRKLQAF